MLPLFTIWPTHVLDAECNGFTERNVHSVATAICSHNTILMADLLKNYLLSPILNYTDSSNISAQPSVVNTEHTRTKSISYRIKILKRLKVAHCFHIFLLHTNIYYYRDWKQHNVFLQCPQQQLGRACQSPVHFLLLCTEPSSHRRLLGQQWNLLSVVVSS